ncbi:hypothetical protein BDN72DRAFT_500611 [Pluteus cervinus]|uniref:Uncharacterized protein n=1 Tax=Pluteus cervinus TaxID=181527 RepID=A0ACD3B006_9AGAR|nr:hypothetical protein BDN72DRAFT_500611 [Pluteus cervinus]
MAYSRPGSWDVGACQDYCDAVPGCGIFVNMFYHFNSGAICKLQIKCAAYGNIHTAGENANSSGQQILPLPTGKTYTQESVVHASTTVLGPPVPDGSDLVFGPLTGRHRPSSIWALPPSTSMT